MLAVGRPSPFNAPQFTPCNQFTVLLHWITFFGAASWFTCVSVQEFQWCQEENVHTAPVIPLRSNILVIFKHFSYSHMQHFEIDKRRMHLTVHGHPGTAAAAVYDRLMHARARTYTPTHIQTDTHSSAEGSRWSRSHKTPFCQTPPHHDGNIFWCN